MQRPRALNLRLVVVTKESRSISLFLSLTLSIQWLQQIMTTHTMTTHTLKCFPYVIFILI